MIAINAETARLIVVRTVIGIRKTGLTGVIVHDPPGIVAALSQMRMKQIVVRLLRSVKRTIVSQAWLRACYSTVAHWIRTETGIFENVSVTATANVRETETETETESGIVSVSVSVSVIGNANGIGSMHHDQDVMTLLAIMIGKDGIARKSVRECTVGVLKEARWRSYPTVMNGRLLRDAEEQRMRTITTVETREIQRLDKPPISY